MSGRRFVIVSGLSGAGKSVALRALEDADFYCVDNLPAALLVNFSKFIDTANMPHYRQVAVGVDARNPATDLSQFPEVLRTLQDLEFDVELLYLDASDETIISRFSETRRKHPLSSSDQPLAAAINQERVLMENLSALADLRLDTSNSLVHQFRSLITDRVARRPAGTLSLQFCSFGYKNGVPADADFVFDLRCLPNPYWDPALRGLTGRDSDIQNFFHAHPMVDAMINDIIGFFDKWIAVFESENRSYLTVALGCTGGRHRSVFVAERIADHFKNGRRMMLIHRDS
ncbi:MAG: UPF0042 nucleotide-binding protein [Gammaproteobacteria bacterium]|jgi:UPF0042 nucleotide-binding protein